jgi:hypothetical protein
MYNFLWWLECRSPSVGDRYIASLFCLSIFPLSTWWTDQLDLLDLMTCQTFISTLELRMFSESLYSTPYKEDFFLGISSRISFSMENNALIRYTSSSFELVIYYSFHICSHHLVSLHCLILWFYLEYTVGKIGKHIGKDFTLGHALVK